MFEDKNKRECFYHLVLISSKKANVGTESANRKLRDLLVHHNTLENISRNIFGDLFFDDNLKANVPNIDKIESRLKNIPDFKLLTINDPEYPAYLKKIDYAPPVLYLLGDIDLLKSEKSIAVVGTREPEKKDIIEGEKIVKRLIAEKYTIVSGLAKGCDTIGHKKAIDYGGKTIAVLGTPLDVFYPAENKNLQSIISKEHLIVSPYPFWPKGLRTQPSHFAHRNIVTTGLSKDGIVVIRSGDKSGTQHAIRECIKQEKTLYVLANNYSQGYEWVKKYNDKIKVPNIKR